MELISLVFLVSVFCSMTRWSRKYLKGEYDDPFIAFVGHLALGVFPVLGLAFFFAQYLNNREAAVLPKKKEQNRMERAKRKEALEIQREIDLYLKPARRDKIELAMWHSKPIPKNGAKK